MTDRLPHNLLALFAPRPALRYLPPADFPPEERRTAPISAIGPYLEALQEKAEKAKADATKARDIAKVAEATDTPPEDPKEDDPEFEHPPTLSALDKRELEIRTKAEHQKWLVSEGYKEMYKPSEDPQIRGDAFKTLFVGRLPYDAGTADVQEKFDRFGAIERIRIVTNTDSGKSGKVSKKKGKSKGYAFVVFERERDMKAAYKETDRLTIRGRSVIVDVERGRTVNGWKPRRFGGGLGGRHYTKGPTKPPGFGGFQGAPSGPGGGFRGGGFRGDRGGDRGGFRGGRGGFDRGPRGGGGGGYGGRGGIGYSNGMPPDGAPSGPRTGYDRGGSGGGGGYGDDRRGGGGGAPRNANYEPVGPRGGSYRDRDRDGGGGDSYSSGNKRPYDGGGGYNDRESRRRY